jgi:aryl sulfotransferase
LSIVWLASYPKSGNTWLRAVLANYLREKEGPADINNLGSPIASRRHEFDEITGVEASDLTAGEIERLRPAVYRYLAVHSGDPLFQKIHDAYLPALIPTDATRGAIYVIRNPLDIAVSYSHHAGVPFDRAISWMGDPAYTLAGGRRSLANQLRQRVLTWSAHVLSWVDQSAFPVHVLRYEDMILRDCETFAAALQFAGLRCEPARLRCAIENSSFDKLQQQEKTGGFQERPASAEIFFREGKAGGWREALDILHVEWILRGHAEVMRRFGYVTEDGKPAV